MTAPLFRFYNPVKIISGEKALDSLGYELKQLGAKRPLIITDPGVSAAGLIEFVQTALAGADFPAEILFDQVPAGWRQEGCVSVHAIELPYIFGTVDIDRDWISLYTLASTSGAKTCPPKIDDADKQVSQAMMKMWTSFASTGNPNVPGLIAWPAWESGPDKYLYVSDKLRVKTGYSRLPFG